MNNSARLKDTSEKLQSALEKYRRISAEIQTGFEEAKQLLTSMEKHCDDIAKKLSETETLLKIYEDRTRKERVACYPPSM